MTIGSSGCLIGLNPFCFLVSKQLYGSASASYEAQWKRNGGEMEAKFRLEGKWLSTGMKCPKRKVNDKKQKKVKKIWQFISLLLDAKMGR